MDISKLDGYAVRLQRWQPRKGASDAGHTITFRPGVKDQTAQNDVDDVVKKGIKQQSARKQKNAYSAKVHMRLAVESAQAIKRQREKLDHEIVTTQY